MSLTQTRLKSILCYDPQTGIWTWLVSCRGTAAGSITGCPNSAGYNRITIDGHSYLTSRLAYLYMTGKWPAHQMDHINRNQRDERWSNLRPATQSQNNHNQGPNIKNTSGCKGVVWLKRERRWLSLLQIDGKIYRLGYFINLKDAVNARKAAETKYLVY